MKKYEYKSRNPQGKAVTGTLDAETEAEAVQELRRRGLTVTSIQGNLRKRKGQKFSISLPSFSKGKNVTLFQQKVTRKEMVPVTRQLSTMFQSGIPLVEALEVIEEQAENPTLKNLFAEISSDVRQGKDFSVALARHKSVFDDIFINMVRAGEASGQLDDVLDRLATHMEEAEELRREIVSAMTYPVVSLVIIGAISVGLLVFVLPEFATMFANMNQELNQLTLFVMGLSAFAQSKWVWGIAAMIGAVFLYKAACKTEKGEFIRDWLILRIPVFGMLMKKTILSRFSSTFATLIRSGVPILGALEIVGTTTGNVPVAH